MSWTTAADIARRVETRWKRGELLRARIEETPLFPMRVPLKRPSPGEIADRFGDVQDWAHALADASRERRGFGFELERETRRNRVQGANALPVAAVIPTEADALRLIGCKAAAERFQHVADATLARYPQLRAWLARRPLTALDHADEWPAVMAVLDWFETHPRPGLYLRQLDIPNVDTKFIEKRRALLAELLDAVLPASAVDRTAVGAAGFNRRYGLRSAPPLVRFRVLDPGLYIPGLSDLSLPPEQFAALDLRVTRVFITENLTNGLAFPGCADSIVIFGLGYGLERLSEVRWLQRAETHYWGDIDTHGFGMLQRLRGALPSVRSFLMDRETLVAHRPLWGQEPAAARYSGDVSRLTDAERELFEALALDRLGERVRLEQERIAYTWLQQTLERAS